MQKRSAPLAKELVREPAAIGVSGSPGRQFDEGCARAAIAKIQGRMK